MRGEPFDRRRGGGVGVDGHVVVVVPVSIVSVSGHGTAHLSDSVSSQAGDALGQLEIDVAGCAVGGGAETLEDPGDQGTCGVLQPPQG